MIRAALPFGILIMAGTLAKEFGILPETIDVAAAVQWAWSRFTKSTDAMALSPEVQAVNALRLWVAERWNSSIRSTTGDNSQFREQTGWYDGDAVYIPAERLREAAGSSLKEIEIGRALNNLGYIAKKKSSDVYYCNYVPQIGKLKAYALTRKEFGRTGKDHDDPILSVIPGGRS